MIIPRSKGKPNVSSSSKRSTRSSSVSTKRFSPENFLTPQTRSLGLRTQHELNQEESQPKLSASTKNIPKSRPRFLSVRAQLDLSEEENEPEQIQKQVQEQGVSVSGKSLINNDLQASSSSLKRPKPSLRTQNDLNEEENKSQSGVCTKRVVLLENFLTPKKRTEHDLNQEHNVTKQGSSTCVKRPKYGLRSLKPPSEVKLSVEENETQQSIGVSMKRILPGKCLVDHDLQGTPVLDLINFQFWYDFTHIDCAMHVNLVREFYANVKKSKNHSLVSQVQGKEICLNMEILGKIFNIPNKGVCAYTDKSWPIKSMENADKNACLEFLWGNNNQVNYLETPDKTLLPPDKKIILNIIMDAILPRDMNNNKVDCLDGYILFLMYQRRKINLPYIMLHHMLNVGRKGKSLAYGVPLTRVFEYFGIPLIDKSGSFNPSWYLDMRSLNWMEIYWYNGRHIDGSKFKTLSRDIRGEILDKTRMGTTFEVNEGVDYSEHNEWEEDEEDEENEEREEREEMCVTVTTGDNNNNMGEEGFTIEGALKQILIKVEKMNDEMKMMNDRIDGINEKVNGLEASMNNMWDDIQERLPLNKASTRF